MSDLIQKAHDFAKYWFEKQDQRRKYTNEPYMVHPVEVAELVKTVPHDDNMICAAYLHDTVEDTPVTIDEIYGEFNPDIGSLVGWLTDISKPEDGNRKQRKAKDRAHTAQSPARAQTVKICDLISNSKSIVALDPKFAAVYIPEKQLVLNVLTKGDATLRKQAQKIIDDYNDLKVGAVVLDKTFHKKQVGIVTEVFPPVDAECHGGITVLFPKGTNPSRPSVSYHLEHYCHRNWENHLQKNGKNSVDDWSPEEWTELEKELQELESSDPQVQIAKEEYERVKADILKKKNDT